MARMGDLRYATDLVAFIREEHGDHFRIDVGCYPEIHPQADDALADLRHFKAKIDAGAELARSPSISTTPTPISASSTMPASSASRCRSFPGIMPISNFTQLKRFSEACGAEIPRWIGKRMSALGDDADGIRELAADLVGGDVPPPDRSRRARAAFLHAEPEQTHAKP